MTPADMARENSISFECKKDALQQKQSGDWKVSFTIQSADMDERLTKAPMGTRFVAVLVEVGDDELPVTKSATIAPDADSSTGAKRQWRDMQPAQQAGIRCVDPVFAAFLKEQYPEDWRALEGDCAELVRYICGVTSRSQLNTVQSARDIWRELDDQFVAWKALENA
jgi:hypothetical protein